MSRAARPRRVAIYSDDAEREPFTEWLDGLEAATSRRIVARVNRMRLGNFGDHKGVGEGVQELRLDFGPGFRVYFAEDGETVVLLLCGGDKRSQKADIRRAQANWHAYQKRKEENP